MAFLHQIYLRGHGVDDPRVSPIKDDFIGAPPTLIHVGRDEILRDDSHAMAAKLTAAGTSVRVQEYETGFHVFHLTSPLTPEAREAIADIAGFVKASLKKTDS